MNALKLSNEYFKINELLIVVILFRHENSVALEKLLNLKSHFKFEKNAKQIVNTNVLLKC